MESITITQTDISNLAGKLDELADVLSAKEKQVLLAVFKLASAEVSRRLQGPAGQETESGALSNVAARTLTTTTLSAGFKDTFSAVSASSFALQPGSLKAGGVGIGVIW